MSIKLSKNKLSINQIIEQKSEKIFIEGDEIVPDIKPDILSIVCTNGNCLIYKKEIKDGIAKIEGCINVYITYIADNQKFELRTINANLNFNKIFEIKRLKKDMNLECLVNLQEIDCKILNGRKISLRANTEFKFTCYSKNNIEYIDSIDENKDMQFLSKKININSLVGEGKTKAFAKDTITIDNEDNLIDIIKSEIKLENKEIKISYNKVLTKADAKFNIVYLTQNQKVKTAKASIPVMGFIDIQDISEENICDAFYEMRNLIIKPNSIDEHSIHIEAEIGIDCYVYKNNEINIIEDLYSKEKELKFERENIKLIKEKDNIESILNIKKQERIDELKDSNIYDCDAKIKILNTRVETNKILYQGEINLYFIYKEEKSNRINVKNIVEPFDFEVESEKILNKEELNTNIEIIKKEYILESDNSVNLDVDIKFKIDVTKEIEISLINKIEESKEKKENTHSLVIYYTKSNETLWDIAKRFGSTIEEIVKINTLENTDRLIEGEQLFIPR